MKIHKSLSRCKDGLAALGIFGYWIGEGVRQQAIFDKSRAEEMATRETHKQLAAALRDVGLVE